MHGATLILAITAQTPYPVQKNYTLMMNYPQILQFPISLTLSNMLFTIVKALQMLVFPSLLQPLENMHFTVVKI